MTEDSYYRKLEKNTTEDLVEMIRIRDSLIKAEEDKNEKILGELLLARDIISDMLRGVTVEKLKRAEDFIKE